MGRFRKARHPTSARDVEIRQDTVIAALRRLQDLLLAGSALDELLLVPSGTSAVPEPESELAAHGA
ncbi:hypothetical protein [Streptomyces cavernae]|uniref:hypothetical protein n=1 Tax=Streptomyces cavernae TaxID=2259034 RepID=UPI000FEB9ED2|nr:hypothetical protein [Streptomyces cavernae]